MTGANGAGRGGGGDVEGEGGGKGGGGGGEVPEADGTGDRCVSVLGSAVSIDGDDQRVAGNRRAQMSGTRLVVAVGADETVRPLQAHAGHSSRGSLHVNGIWSSDLVGIAISVDSVWSQ